MIKKRRRNRRTKKMRRVQHLARRAMRFGEQTVHCYVICYTAASCGSAERIGHVGIVNDKKSREQAVAIEGFGP
jgi:hypothetical protein